MRFSRACTQQEKQRKDEIELLLIDEVCELERKWSRYLSRIGARASASQ